jgi:hypothetical protein
MELAPLSRRCNLALDADRQEAVGRAYSALQEACTRLNRFEESERHSAEGMAYCEGRELGVFSTCLMGWRAHTLMLQGRWDEAADAAAQMLARPRVSPVNRLNPVLVLGSIHGRRDETGAWDLLDEALALAEGTAELHWIAPVRVARAELRWLSGRPDLAIQEVRPAYDRMTGQADGWMLGSMVAWLARLQASADLPSGLPEPFGLEIAGDCRGAAMAWERIGRPYDAALAWLGSADDAGLRQALSTLDDLRARATAGAARRRMKELGIKAIPRGPQRATRAAPAGLTARQQEVLALMSEGLATTMRSPGGCSSPNGRLTITSPLSCPRSAFRPGWRQPRRRAGWASWPPARYSPAAT